MGGWMRKVALVAGLGLASGALAAEGPPLQSTSGSTCANKRTDACGCHHHFGLRHCHPKKRTPRCESPVKAELPQTPKSETTPLVHL